MLIAIAAAAALAQAACPAESAPGAANCPAAANAFFVFFDWESMSINPAAAATLDNAVIAYRRSNSSGIVLNSHTDRVGPARRNLRVSQIRAERVRDYLMARGVLQSAIRINAYGESRPPVPTADGVREPQNRLVEFRLLPPAD